MFDLSFADNRVWYRIVSIFILFYQVILINRLSAFNNLSYFNSLFPGVFYVLVLSLIPDIHPLSPVMLGNTFLIIAISQLFQTIHRNQRSKRLFNAGFFVCVAALFNLNFIYFIPFFIIAANAIILVRIRDAILYVLGFLTPLYFLFAYWILVDQLAYGIRLIGEQFHFFQYEFIYQSYGIIKAGIISALVLFLLAIVGTVITRTNIFVRNKLTFLFYLMVFALIVFGFTFHTRLEDLQLIILPLGILIGLYLIGLKKGTIAESFHLLILILVVLFQYFLK